MKRRIAVIVALAAAAAAGAWYVAWPARGKALPHRTAPVERGGITDAITATGTINPVSTVQVGTQVSGTIQSIGVDFNSPVRKGQVIARIEPRLFEAAAVQAKGNLANARADFARSRVLAEDAARTLRRAGELAREGFAAQAEVDSARTAYDAAVAQRDAAQAQVEQATGALEVAEANLRYTTIHSPVDGIVISRNVDVGQTVAASFQTPTLFTIARDLTRMQIDTNVDEADIGKARAGQRAEFTVDAYPGRAFAGEVVQVRNAPQVTQNVVTYNVVVRVDNRELLLKPGMTATVSIRVRTIEDVLKIPNAALRFSPTEPEPEENEARRTGERVYVLTPEGKPRPVPVKTGISDGSFTQLVSGELREGDRVVTSETGKKAAAPRGGLPGFGGMR